MNCEASTIKLYNGFINDSNLNGIKISNMVHTIVPEMILTKAVNKKNIKFWGKNLLQYYLENYISGSQKYCSFLDWESKNPQNWLRCIHRKINFDTILMKKIFDQNLLERDVHEEQSPEILNFRNNMMVFCGNGIQMSSWKMNSPILFSAVHIFFSELHVLYIKEIKWNNANTI